MVSAATSLLGFFTPHTATRGSSRLGAHGHYLRRSSSSRYSSCVHPALPSKWPSLRALMRRTFTYYNEVYIPRRISRYVAEFERYEYAHNHYTISKMPCPPADVDNITLRSPFSLQPTTNVMQLATTVERMHRDIIIAQEAVTARSAYTLNMSQLLSCYTRRLPTF